MEAQLTPGAVQAIVEQPDGAGMIQPVLQVVDVRPVTTKNAPATPKPADRFRMMLSDGTHTQQSMLATALNNLVKDGALRPGTIIHLNDFMCNTIQTKRIIIVVKLDILQNECAIIGNPKHYEPKSVAKEQDPNLQVSAAQTNSGTYCGGLSKMGSSVAPRAEQAAISRSYGGPYNSAQGIAGSSIGHTVEPAPRNVFTGVSHGTISTQNIVNANMVQPTSQQSSLNPNQNQRFVAPASGGGYGPPVNAYGQPARPSYQQPPPVYMNRAPAARNDSTTRIIPITALNPYQNKWTIKARVTAKTDIRHWNNAKGSGTLFSFDLLDAHGGEIRASCFKEAVDKFYSLIEVGRVYLISRGALKPAQKKYNTLNNDYEINLEASLSSVEVCPDDDTSIPRLQYNFRQISELESIDNEAIVDLLGVVISVNPSLTIMRKNGTETQRRTLQLKDLSGRSIELTLWGNFCDVEGQQLQLQCDSGLNPVVALKGVRVSDYGGRSVGTISSTQFIINPDFPEVERLKQWYLTEGKTAPCISLSREMSSMGRADVRKTIAQIKDDNLGQSDKPDWIVIKAAISHVPTDFCYPACPLIFNAKQCNKKAINNGDGAWHCDRCDQSFEKCEYRYLVTFQIQDHTGTTYATAFQEAGEQIFGRKAEEIFSIRNDDQDDAQFTEIMEGVRWHLYLFKLRVKEETYNDESRVKCSIVKAEKLDPSKESTILLGAIDSLLLDGSGSSPRGQSAVTPNAAGLNDSVGGHSVFKSNNAYAMNTGGANQFGQQTSLYRGIPTPLSATHTQTCSLCGANGHNAQNCHAGVDMNRQRAPAGGNYSSTAGNASSDLCFKCQQPGHWARDCPMATGPQHQTHGNSVASRGYGGQSFVGGY
ncbi:hypothetical protein GUJ93_ZPchr0010g7975 [Zizania palustris]|uniref:Replication protein A subunit n=1 Tax=Zizania palustris TaxID=103762 RepID=A0A8J5W7P3_ZIZPA|nr:hypothetical protein GUJ93_ZPchr0010g7975 [Zizania palustris]